VNENRAGDRQPRWRELLTLAERQLKEIGLTCSNWTSGGGTVLTLRHRHRPSRDIDLFLNDPQVLSFLSPRLNDSVAMVAYHIPNRRTGCDSPSGMLEKSIAFLPLRYRSEA